MFSVISLDKQAAKMFDCDLWKKKILHLNKVKKKKKILFV